jgi:hypothetical protein
VTAYAVLLVRRASGTAAEITFREPSLAQQAQWRLPAGSVAERFKAPVLKTGDGQPSVSSNLTASASSHWCAEAGFYVNRRFT